MATGPHGDRRPLCSASTTVTRTPEGSSTANPGSLFMRNASGTGFAYVKKTGTGNTGWDLLPDKQTANVWTQKQTFSGEIEVDGALNHDGSTVGFFGVAPVTQRTANADTSGATLAALETEVNELKALLRAYGLLAP